MLLFGATAIPSLHAIHICATLCHHAWLNSRGGCQHHPSGCQVMFLLVCTCTGHLLVTRVTVRTLLIRLCRGSLSGPSGGCSAAAASRSGLPRGRNPCLERVTGRDLRYGLTSKEDLTHGHTACLPTQCVRVRLAPLHCFYNTFHCE